MRRAVLTIGGTAASLAALFSFTTHSPIQAAAISTPAAGAPSASASGTSPTGPAYPTASSLAPPASKPSGAASKTAAKSASASASNAPTSAAPATSKAGTAPTSSAPAKAPTHAPTTPAAPATSAPAGKSGSFTGATANTQYGPVDVTVTLSNGKITAANGSLEGQGDSVGQNALPVLNGEAVSAQSANIQAVSGATYTSQGYIQSLQSALDQAGV